MTVKWLTGALALVAMPVFAQQMPAATPPGDAVTAQARFQVRIMEGVLENAVQHGAQLVSAQMRMVSPDIALFSGPARARGFRLGGYGVFFAVDVPALHRSVSWSVRTLTQGNGDLTRAIQSIRRMVQTQHDAQMKTELEQALRLVELQVGPTPSRSPVLANAMVPQQTMTPMSSAAPQASAAMAADPGQLSRDNVVADNALADNVMADPSGAYTDAVQRAIVDAMLDYGTTLSLGTDEWLTVAARENSDAMLAGDLTESVTITLRVKAADLEAFKSGRLTRDEVRQRVEVRQL